MAKKIDSISRAGVQTPSTTKEETPETPPVDPKNTIASAPLSPEGTPLPESDNYDSLFPEPSVVVGKPPKWVWWLLLLIASILLAVVGFKVANGSIDSWLSVASPSPTTTPALTNPLPSNSPVPSPVSTPTPASTPTPPPSPSDTPSPTPTSTPILKSNITLRVLNGTTLAGAASKAKTNLENAGFNVRTVGNAQQQNYSNTIVYYQSGRETEARLVSNALTQTNPTLEESSLAAPDMVLVVIGLK